MEIFKRTSILKFKHLLLKLFPEKLAKSPVQIGRSDMALIRSGFNKCKTFPTFKEDNEVRTASLKTTEGGLEGKNEKEQR